MNRTLLFTLASLLLLASCERIHFEDVEIGKLYVGTCQGKDYMVLIEQAEEGASEGRIYYDNGELVAGDNPFNTDLTKNGEGSLWVGGVEKQLTKVTLKNNSLHGFVNDEEFELQLVPDVEQQYKPLYKDCCYHVTKERGKVYAPKVSGYWMSYPDRNEGLAMIYLRKFSDLISTSDWNLNMDLYYPTEIDNNRLRPLLVLIHGGAFYNGDKGDIGYPKMGEHFAERGYVVASINYRLGFGPSADKIDRAGFRALQDAYAAICYLKENAEEFGIDTTLIFTAGTSAGAITALNLAFMRDKNRPDAVLEEGLINMISGEYGQPFRVKAVANMWGAIHDLSMLSNSTETAIISFHGDKDHIVPYEYGCPFDSVLELEIDNFLYKIAKPPVNQLVFHPMQGSKAIHDKALTIKRKNGEPMRSEMHTVHGGSIHHLHKDEYGHLTKYFYDTILPATTRFFYEELVGGVTVGLAQSETDERWFNAYGTDNVAELYWKVEGGAVVRNSDNNRVKVLLFGNAPKHTVKICGKYKNGVEFEETLPLKGSKPSTNNM